MVTKKIWVFDIESDSFEAENEKPINFRFAYFISDKNDIFYADSLESFSSFLISLCKRNNGRNEQNVIYAHNLMFDFSFCVKPLLERGLTIVPIENGGKLIFVKAGKYRKKVRMGIEDTEFDNYLEFRDSYSLFQTSLKNLGSFVGLEKIEHDKQWKETITDEDKEYCLRDCEIVLHSLKKFADFYSEIMEQEIPLHKIPLTTASSAFKIFKKHNSQEKEITTKCGKLKKIKECSWILKKQEDNDFFLENYYFGGRVEVFSCTLVENVSYFDINSLYPSVMINNWFHAPPYIRRPFIVRDLQDPRTVGFFAIVDESREKVPLFPVHRDKGLYFPACEKTLFIFREEYEYAVSRKVPIKIVETLASANFPKKPFEYLKEFYERKKKKDSMAYFYKILMNSTYGRFGIQTERDSVKIAPIESSDLLDSGVEIVNDEFVKIHEIKELKFERNAVIACKITALARLEITKWIHRLLENGIRVYYCDTDSIVCQENSILPLTDELGGFKKEHEFVWFAPLSAKEYCARIKNSDEYLVKLKGVHTADIESLFDYHDEGTQQLNVSKFRTAVRNGWIDLPRNMVLMKKCNTLYHKRVFFNDFSLPIRNFDKLKAIEKNNEKYVFSVLMEIKKKVQAENE